MADAKKTAETKKTAESTNESKPGEQKKASDAKLVHDPKSTLVGGPTQDDLNPAFAPTKDEDESEDK